jgi:hypothetical protein
MTGWMASGPTKAERASTARWTGSPSKIRRCNVNEPVVAAPVTVKPASNLAELGRCAAHQRSRSSVALLRVETTYRNWEWIVEGDIAACFDEISHPALMDRMRARVADRRLLDLIKAFLQ